MNIALWIIQIVLAILYIMAGLYKVSGQGPALEESMPGFSLTLIRLVGVGEALAGLVLVLPLTMRSWAKIAGWAGAVLAVEAVVFVVYHLSHGAYKPAVATVILGLLAAFVAVKRFK